MSVRQLEHLLFFKYWTWIFLETGQSPEAPGGLGGSKSHWHRGRFAKGTVARVHFFMFSSASMISGKYDCKHMATFCNAPIHEAKKIVPPMLFRHSYYISFWYISVIHYLGSYGIGLYCYIIYTIGPLGTLGQDREPPCTQWWSIVRASDEQKSKPKQRQSKIKASPVVDESVWSDSCSDRLSSEQWQKVRP